jgi:hypothetical protein
MSIIEPKFEIRPETISISSEIAQCLESFCRGLEIYLTGNLLPDEKTVRQGLKALSDVFHATRGKEDDPSWEAIYYPAVSSNGGTVHLKGKIHGDELVISSDRNGALYGGTWTHLDESHTLFCLFDVESSPSGDILRLRNDDFEKSFQLDDPCPGFTWTTPENVLAFLPPWLDQGVETIVKSLKGSAKKPEQNDSVSDQEIFTCKNCGALLQPGAKFCSQCAAPVPPSIYGEKE